VPTHPVLSQRDAPAPTLNDSYFFLAFFTAPYFLRAAFSQPERLRGGWAPNLFRQAFSAAASFCLFVSVFVLVAVLPASSLGNAMFGVAISR
jgi:hypothetical protein